jgi:uncharacterized membrane protein
MEKKIFDFLYSFLLGVMSFWLQIISGFCFASLEGLKDPKELMNFYALQAFMPSLVISLLVFNIMRKRNP